LGSLKLFLGGSVAIQIAMAVCSVISLFKLRHQQTEEGLKTLLIFLIAEHVFISFAILVGRYAPRSWYTWCQILDFLGIFFFITMLTTVAQYVFVT
jgi:hypothetical protein